MKLTFILSLSALAILLTSCQSYPPPGHGPGYPPYGQRYQGYHGEPAWKRNLKRKRRLSQVQEIPNVKRLTADATLRVA